MMQLFSVENIEVVHVYCMCIRRKQWGLLRAKLTLNSVRSLIDIHIYMSIEHLLLRLSTDEAGAQ